MTALVILCRALFIFLACIGGVTMTLLIFSKRIRHEIHACGILYQELQRVGEDSEQRIAEVQACNECQDETPAIADYKPRVHEFHPRKPIGQGVAHAAH